MKRFASNIIFPKGRSPFAPAYQRYVRVTSLALRLHLDEHSTSTDAFCKVSHTSKPISS